jgi:hypothetical protein
MYAVAGEDVLLFYLVVINPCIFLRKAVLLLRRKATARFAAETDMHLKRGLCARSAYQS